MTSFESADGAATRPLRFVWLVLLLITCAAAFLRLSALDRLPPGLYHDEAYNGLDALGVLQGHMPIFFEANNGREPLFIYLAAISVGILGRSPGALRIVSAVLGTFTVPAVYWLGRELFNRRVGLMGAVLTATTVWTLNLSRVAFRAVSMPLLAAISLALLWSGLRRRRLARMALAGAVYGLSLYTYLAARFSVIALLLFIIYVLLWHRPNFWLRGWLVFALLSAIVVLPLGLYFLTHWQETIGRAAQVSILNASVSGGDLWGTLLRHTWRALSGFWDRGDFIPRHNVPLRPVFDPLIALAFLGGMLLALSRWRRDPAYGLILIWLATMLMPTILAENPLHMLRASGVLPVLFFFPALGLLELYRFLRARNARWIGLALVFGMLAVSSAQSLSDYARHLESEAVYYNFEAGATQLAVTINRFLGNGWQGRGLMAHAGNPTIGRRAYIATRLWRDWASVRYLCPESDALTILPAQGNDIPMPRSDEQVLLAFWPFEDYDMYLSLLPHDRLIVVEEGAKERGDLESVARLLYITFATQPADAVPRNMEAAWADGIKLLGYNLLALANELQIDLYWQAVKPISAGYTVFCHALCGETLIGQHDGPPAWGYYPTDEWRVGDIVRDRHIIPLRVPYDDSTCRLLVGLYRLETLQRLNLLDASGKPTQESGVILH